MKKIILIVGIIVIAIVTFFNFNHNLIKYIYYKTSINYKYKNKVVEYNEYKLEDNFLYFDNYTDPMINNKTELLNTIYHSINGGISSITRYCSKDYLECLNDLEDIRNSEILLPLANNFAHPYNSFNSINFSTDKYLIGIDINNLYSKEEIDIINEKVDSIIKDNITDTMTDTEKIKVIHDYIINNTKYDVLKIEDNSPYKSETAYGVLIQGYGICSGYADAIAIFLNRFNIINYKINNDTHIWNVVYLDNKWLHLDLTSDDPITNNGKIDTLLSTYLLITDDKLKSLQDEIHSYDENIYLEFKKSN